MHVGVRHSATFLHTKHIVTKRHHNTISIASHTT
jgi:hypothetical protein